MDDFCRRKRCHPLCQSRSSPGTRTWVSGVGDDANPCSRTAPCKTFAGAISKTAAGGEINVLDPGGFGAVTITKSITIRSDHIEAGVLVSGTNAIIVSAGAADKVVLEGLDIEGLGTGIHGVSILAGKEIYIIRCSIRHFTQNGVDLASSTFGGHAFVNDSLISFNAVVLACRDCQQCRVPHEYLGPLQYELRGPGG